MITDVMHGINDIKLDYLTCPLFLDVAPINQWLSATSPKNIDNYTPKEA